MRSLGSALTGAQTTLIVLKLLDLLSWSWPLVLLPTIAITLVTGAVVLVFVTFWGRL
jgi:hypothetical protein